MKTFRETCKELGIERFNSVVATVSGFNKEGTYAVIDGTDFETYYHGGTQPLGAKVLLSIDGISEKLERIYATFDSDYGLAA